MNTTTTPRITTPTATHEAALSSLETSLRTTDETDHSCVEAHREVLAPPDVDVARRVAPAPARRPAGSTGLRRVAWAIADYLWAPSAMPTSRMLGAMQPIDRLGERI